MPKIAQASDLTAVVSHHLAGGSLARATVGLWGFRHRAVPDPRALELIQGLLNLGVAVQVYDPYLDASVVGVIGALDPYEAVRDADVLVTFGDSADFVGVDLDKVREIMGTPAIVDATQDGHFESFATLGFSYSTATSAVLLHPAVREHNNQRGSDTRRLVSLLSSNRRELGGASDGPITSKVRQLHSTAKEDTLQPQGLGAKRAFDILVGIPLALAALPLIGIFAIGIAISFKCWPFFTQWRAGKDGQQFRFLKIRTLPPNTPAYAHKFNLDVESLPKLARFLRTQHLDELPQLLLVPLGKMSLVGPRPKMPDDKEPIEPVFGRLRTTVPQGCTGLWQIGEHAHLRVCDSADYDYAYLRYGSVRFDMWILWRTALLLIGKNKAVSLADDSSIPTWARGRGYLTADVVPTVEPIAA